MEKQTEQLETQNKPNLIEKEFYVLTVNQLNKKTRQHSTETVQGWIDALKNKEVQFYKIEYAIDTLEKDVKNHFINDSLYCGIVVELELRGDELYAKAKFKTKAIPNPEMVTNPNFYDDLTLVPKGKGYVKNNIIYNYELFGFNLVESKKSTFKKEIETKDIETPQID